MARTLVVEVGGQKVAFDPAARHEVVERAAITPLPLGAPLLLGLTPVHGRAVPVVNLAYLMGQPETGSEQGVLTSLGSESVVLPVDYALGLLDVPSTAASGELLGAPVQVDGLGLDEPVRLLNAGALIERVRTHLERL